MGGGKKDDAHICGGLYGGRSVAWLREGTKRYIYEESGSQR